VHFLCNDSIDIFINACRNTAGQDDQCTPIILVRPVKAEKEN
jgi:hypothetical protein